MNRDEKLKLKRKLNVTDLAGEKVMIDFETGKYFLIKGVGNDIWDMLQEEQTEDALALLTKTKENPFGAPRYGFSGKNEVL